MKVIKPDNYTQNKKSICDWTVKMKTLIPYRMLNFYVRHGMIVDKVHEIISLRQSKWLEKYFNFNTTKRNKAKNDFEKDLLKTAFYGQTVKNVKNKVKLKIIGKDDNEKFIKHQPKLTFNDAHKSYTNYDSYTVKQTKDLRNFEDILDFSNLSENHELFSKKNEI